MPPIDRRINVHDRTMEFGHHWGPRVVMKKQFEKLEPRPAVPLACSVELLTVNFLVRRTRSPGMLTNS